jgi:hypothetical protein
MNLVLVLLLWRNLILSLWYAMVVFRILCGAMVVLHVLAMVVG